MKTLKEINFNDFVKLKRGYDLPNDKIVDGKYPVVASTSIKAFHKEYKVLPPSVVTGRSGSLGEVQFIDMPCWPLNTALYVKNFNKNNPKYVYYFLKMIHLENFNSGAGVPTLNQNHLHKLKIKVHSEKEQQQIAEILSTYDDLIETNNQRIATLEQLAQQIYKEWFVRMRFPGWETTPFHHGIPEGWEICKLESLCRNLTDGTHDTPKPTSHGHFLVTGKHINRENFIDFSQAYFISETDHKKISNRSGLDEGDIVFSNIGTIGSCAIIKGETDFSVKNVLIFKPKEKYLTTFLFYLLTNSSTLEQLLLSSSGASQQFIGLTFARDFKVLVPKYDLIEQFNALVEPVVEQKYVLNKNNQLLAKTRNLLLPRLISGKLTIKQAEALAT